MFGVIFRKNKKLFEDGGSILEKTKNGSLKLSVLCGTVGLYEVEIILNKEETLKYNELGDNFIKRLSKEISQNPEKYSERKINT